MSPVQMRSLCAVDIKRQGIRNISNNAASWRGRKGLTSQSLYYPRVMMRTLAQVLTEEYSEYGVHVANVVIDGLIDSPGTRALPRAQQHPEVVMHPVKIAEAFYYLHYSRSCTGDVTRWRNQETINVWTAPKAGRCGAQPVYAEGTCAR